MDALISDGRQTRVYRARHPDSPRAIALRLIKASVDEELRRRLQARFPGLVTIEHPALLALIDVGTVDDHLVGMA